MTIAFTLAWRSLASRPARSCTAALGIAVGIATVLSVQVVDRNTILTQERLAARQSLGRPDVQIRPIAPVVRRLHQERGRGPAPRRR